MLAVYSLKRRYSSQHYINHTTPKIYHLSQDGWFTLCDRPCFDWFVLVDCSNTEMELCASCKRRNLRTNPVKQRPSLGSTKKLWYFVSDILTRAKGMEGNDARIIEADAKRIIALITGDTTK